MARRNERPLSGSPSRDINEGNPDSLNPQASIRGTSTVVESPETAKAEKLKNLANGLGAISQGAEAFFRLQAFYGEQNLKENQLRAAMGLEKSKGKGLEWGVDKGFIQGTGQADSLKFSNAYIAELEGVSFGFDSQDAVIDPSKAEKKRQEIFDRLSKQYLSDTQNTDYLSGAQHSILEAKLSGEKLAQQELIKAKETYSYQKMFDATREQVKTWQGFFMGADTPSAVLKDIRSRLKIFSDNYMETYKVPRETANSAIIDAIGSQVEDLLSDDTIGNDVYASNLLRLLKAEDKDGFSYNKYNPYRQKIQQIQNRVDTEISQKTINTSKAIKAWEDDTLSKLVIDFQEGRLSKEQVLSSEFLREYVDPVNPQYRLSDSKVLEIKDRISKEIDQGVVTDSVVLSSLYDMLDQQKDPSKAAFEAWNKGQISLNEYKNFRNEHRQVLEKQRDRAVSSAGSPDKTLVATILGDLARAEKTGDPEEVQKVLDTTVKLATSGKIPAHIIETVSNSRNNLSKAKKTLEDEATAKAEEALKKKSERATSLLWQYAPGGGKGTTTEDQFNTFKSRATEYLRSNPLSTPEEAVEHVATSSGLSKKPASAQTIEEQRAVAKKYFKGNRTKGGN